MRFVDEFRDRNIARELAAEIARLARPNREYRLMEVCGGHTHTIYKHGIEDYLPANITLVHGPGCPVCVIPMGRVEDAIHIARQPGAWLTKRAQYSFLSKRCSIAQQNLPRRRIGRPTACIRRRTARRSWPTGGFRPWERSAKFVICRERSRSPVCALLRRFDSRCSVPTRRAGRRGSGPGPLRLQPRSPLRHP